MSYFRLFGNRIPPACIYCENTIKGLTRDKMVLCGKKGVVQPFYSCRLYRYDPLKRTPSTPENIQFDKSDFEL